MTAQQQLTDYNIVTRAMTSATDHDGAHWPNTNLRYANWIRQFGAAVEELVAADLALDRWQENQMAWLRGDADNYRTERAIADVAKEKRTAALRKLTQDA